ncbi:MAG: XRE family transcriptional regulator [Bacteroidales bacterium]|nr:XRE family transcriptional regulator [Bacteroidales bacterium]MBQ8809562.1 XRE family transcriptional regulator [Bacteroidales bacterium]
MSIEVDKKIVSKNLLRLIQESGKSRKQISEAIGVSYSTFTDWSNGRSYPRHEGIVALANFFGVPTSALTEEQKTPVSLRTPAEIGDIIREHREKLGLSYDELATLANTTTMSLRRWEKGKIANPRTDAIENLARALKLPTAILRGIPLTEDQIQKQKLIKEIDKVLSDIHLTDEEIQQVVSYIKFLITQRK